jgi:hypothetical protein
MLPLARNCGSAFAAQSRAAPAPANISVTMKGIAIRVSGIGEPPISVTAAEHRSSGGSHEFHDLLVLVATAGRVRSFMGNSSFLDSDDGLIEITPN